MTADTFLDNRYNWLDVIIKLLMVMLSTVLVILDGYPRSITVLILRLRGPEQKAGNIMDRSNFLLFTGHAGAGCRGGMRAVVPIDFLVLKNNKPWFPVEVKLNQDKPSEN